MTSRPLPLEGKTVLVTGATSGIGKAIAQRAAFEGAYVLLAARGAEAGERIAEQINASRTAGTAGGTTAYIQTADVTRAADAKALVERAMEWRGRLDAAVNNAGGPVGTRPLTTLDQNAWSNEIALNLTSVYDGMHHQIPALTTGGSIVNLASYLSVAGAPGRAAYCAAKHGVLGLTRATALEVAGTGIRINAVLPGGVDTPQLRAATGSSPEAVEAAGALHPLARIAQPSEIAAAVTWLLSDEASFTTGAALSVDGGITAQ